MADYGASSLDIVSVVSGVMRELKIKIPRTELKNIKSINGLIDLFVTSSSES
ncbi:phosphopantetheine-binding protein [Yersinia pestis]